VRGFFTQPVFAEARGTWRGASPALFDASPAYRELNAKFGSALDSPLNSTYDLGFDGINMTHVTQNTVDVVFLRCGPGFWGVGWPNQTNVLFYISHPSLLL
jgi:hypothetical protein